MTFFLASLAVGVALAGVSVLQQADSTFWCVLGWGLIAIGLALAAIAGIRHSRRPKLPPPPAPAPPGPKPSLRLRAGSGSEFQLQTVPEGIDEAMARAAGTQAVRSCTTVLTVREVTNKARAKDVRAQIVASDPPPAPGDNPLPFALRFWEDGSTTIDVPPGGYQRINLFRCVVLADARVWMYTPFDSWRGSPSVEFIVDVLIGDELADRRRFHIERFATGMKGGMPVYDSFPLVQEVGEP